MKFYGKESHTSSLSLFISIIISPLLKTPDGNLPNFAYSNSNGSSNYYYPKSWNIASYENFLL